MEKFSQKFEDISVVPVGDQFLRFLAELVDILRLAQVLNRGFLMLVVLELLDQLLDLVFTCCILLFDCRKWYASNSVVNGVVSCFTVTLRFAWWVPKMILRLGFVDPVDSIASSL